MIKYIYYITCSFVRRFFSKYTTVSDPICINLMKKKKHEQNKYICKKREKHSSVYILVGSIKLHFGLKQVRKD